MWQKKIKNNKMQYGLSALMMMISVGVFTLCWCFLSEFSMFATNVLTEENSSDVYIASFGSTDLLENITDASVKENIKSYEMFTGATVSKPIVYHDKDITLLYQMMLKTEDVTEMPEFSIVDAEHGKVAPSNGEVWIPQVMAGPNKINIGEEITINYDKPVQLKVTGIYTAKLLVTANLGFAPILVNEHDFVEYKDDNAELDTGIFLIHLNENTEEKAEQLNDAYPYSASYVTRKLLQESFVSGAAAVGSIGSFAAIIIFLFTMVMMRYIINVMIKRELKTISLYKSIGYTNKKIGKIYRKGFMVVGTIATIIGAIISINFIGDLGKSYSQYASGFKVTEVTYSMAIFSIVLFILLLNVNMRFALRKTKKMSIMDIMNRGNNYGKRKMAQPLLKYVKSPLGIAINEIWRHKGVSMILILSFVFATYITMFFSMVGYSAYTMTDNANLWFGIPKNNTYVMGNIDDDVVRSLAQEDQQVDSYVYGNLKYAVPLQSDQVENGLNNIKFDLFNNRSDEVTGVRIAGNIPADKYEVALTDKALELFQAKVGDTINLKINNKATRLRITGTYNTLFSSYGIMASVELMKEAVPDYTPYTAFIQLKDTTDFATFKTKLQDEFKDITVEQEWLAIENAMISTKEMLLNASIILSVVIIIAVIINILIVLFIEGTQRRKEYGIMKALGFPNTFIVEKTAIKNTVIATLGITIGLFIHLTISRKMLAAQVIDAFIDDPLLLVAIILLLIILTVSITIIVTGKVKNIATVELMEE